MCLEIGCAPVDGTNIPKKVQNLRSDTMVSFWKIYLHKNGELRSPVYFPKASHGTVSRNGWHVSNRKSARVSGWERGNRAINKGIHVYVNRAIGRRELKVQGYDFPSVLVRVQARRKDIVAYDCYGSEAVCTRIYVPNKNVPFPTKVCHGRIR